MNTFPIYNRTKQKNFQLAGNEKSFFAPIKLNYLFLEPFRTPEISIVGDSIRSFEIFEIDKSKAQATNDYYHYILCRNSVFKETSSANNYFTLTNNNERKFWEFKGNLPINYLLSENKYYELIFNDGTNYFESELFEVVPPPCSLLTAATTDNYKIVSVSEISNTLAKLDIIVPNRFTNIDLYVSYDGDPVNDIKINEYSVNGTTFLPMPYVCTANSFSLYIEIDTTNYVAIRAYNYLLKCKRYFTEYFHTMLFLEVIDIPELRTPAGDSFTNFEITIRNNSASRFTHVVVITIDNINVDLQVDIDSGDTIRYENIIFPTNANSGGVKYVYFSGNLTQFKVHLDIPAIKSLAYCRQVTNISQIIPINFTINPLSVITNQGTASVYQLNGIIKFSTSGTAYNITFFDINDKMCTFALSENQNGIGNIVHGYNENYEQIYADCENTFLNQQSNYFVNHLYGIDLIEDANSIKTIRVAKKPDFTANYVTPL